MKNLKAKVTISRRSNDLVYLQIRDVSSNSDFVEVELELENYALLITGLSSIEGNMEVRGLANVGKTKVSESRSIVAPHLGYETKKFSEWLVANAQEEGWILNPYLSSQKSILNNSDGTKTINYTVYKFVDSDYNQEAEEQP